MNSIKNYFEKDGNETRENTEITENVSCSSEDNNTEKSSTDALVANENTEICDTKTTLATKRSRSEILSSSSHSPTCKKIVYDSEDECLQLPEDAPYWVPTLFKSIDAITAKLEDIEIKFDTFQSDVNLRIDAIQKDTDIKVQNLSDKFIKTSDENSKKINDLTESVIFLSKAYDDQKKTDDILIAKIDTISKRQDVLKNKCLEYEDLITEQADIIDSLEQYGRRNCLLLHGVPENREEETDNVFIESVANHLKVKFQPSDLDRSHRLGAEKPDRPRPIIVKFARYNQRILAFKNKKMLKGTDLMITESLTRKRVVMLQAAKKKYGKLNVWSMDGEILAKVGKDIIKVKDVYTSRIVRD